MTLRRRAALLTCAALLTLPVAACGGDGLTNGKADDEGLYLTINGLKYQVQVSRELNPNDVEDKAYLVGLPRNEAQLRPDETWFAVFLWVQNRTDRPLPAATRFELLDTANNVYTPIPLATANPWAYFGTQVPAKSQLPLPSSAGQNFPGLNGQLLLFKLRNFTFIENRPLELTIFPPNGTRGAESVTLDV
jgi:hypothetical protein